MRRFAFGLLAGAAYSGCLVLLARLGVPFPSPLGVLIPAIVYGVLGWFAAAGAETGKVALTRAAAAGVGATLAAWLVTMVMLWPLLAQGSAAEAFGMLLTTLLAELKFVAIAGLVGRKQVLPVRRLPTPSQQ